MDTRVNRLYNGYSQYGGVQYRLDQLLSTDGEGTLANANAITANEFSFRPLLGIWVVVRILVQIVKKPMIDLLKYGDNELTDGMVVSIKNGDDTYKHIYNPKPLIRVADWALLARAELTDERAIIVLRWTLSAAGVVTLMDAREGEYLSLEVPEAPVGLDSHYLQLQGYRITRWDS